MKRIRPDALGPFDYTQENYTKLLWVAEGLTDYYADLFLRRAGLITKTSFSRRPRVPCNRCRIRPGGSSKVSRTELRHVDQVLPAGRKLDKLADLYYDKGAILGLLLDLEIRKRSKNAKSLDDVLRYLYAEFFKKNRNYAPADFQKACELMAGSSLDDFFNKYVRGKEELDYNAALEAAGLRLETNGPVGHSGEKVYLGADVVQQDERWW